MMVLTVTQGMVMKYIILFLLLASSILFGRDPDAIPYERPMPAEHREACKDHIQDKMKELIADYSKRNDVEEIIKHHANLSYHRLSHAFLKLKEISPNSVNATREFEALTNLLDGDTKANETIDALNTFNNYVYAQQNTDDKKEIKDKFDKIFDGLMQFSQTVYPAGSRESHLALQSGDRNLLLNLLSTKGGNRANLFSHLSQEMNIVLSQRNQSITADTAAQLNFINIVKNKLGQIDKKVINDFVKYMKDELGKFVADSRFPVHCEVYLESFIAAADDVNCIDCEEFKNILSPNNETILSDIFQVLNDEFPIDHPNNLRIQGPRFSGCKIEDDGTNKRLVLLDVTDIPKDRGSDTRDGSTFWIDNCPKNTYASSDQDPSCQSYRENGVIKVKSPEHILHNPQGKKEFSSISVPLLDTTNDTLYIRNDWTAVFQRPIVLSECEKSAPPPTPTDITCDGLNQYFKNHNNEFDGSYSDFQKIIAQKDLTKTQCEEAKAEFKEQLTEVVKADLYHGSIEGVTFEEKHIDEIMSACKVSCEDYQQDILSCSTIPAISNFVTALEDQTSPLNKYSCQEKLEAVMAIDFEPFVGQMIENERLPNDIDEAKQAILDLCKISCDGASDPCDELTKIKIDSTTITDLSRQDLEEHFKSRFTKESYPGFTDAEMILRECFPEQEQVITTDPCDEIQEQFEQAISEMEIYLESKCEIQLKAFSITNPSCDLSCKKESCEDFESYFTKHYASTGDDEPLEGEDCDNAISEIKDELKSSSVAQSCDYSCGEDKDKEKDDNKSKKTNYENETIPQGMLQNMMMQPPSSSKSRRIRGSGR